MTTDLIANICTVLSTMKADQKWSHAHDETYLIGLEDLPDEAGVLLRREILRRWDWRPSVKEICDLWDAISNPALPAAEEMAGRMLHLRRDKGLYQRRIPGDPYGRWEACEPPWTDSLMARLSRAMGGWTVFCCDDSPLGVLRGQLTKAAAAIVGNADDAAVDVLRLEYQSARAALPAPDTAPTLPENVAALRNAEAPFTVDAHPAVVARLGTMVRRMPSGGDT